MPQPENTRIALVGIIVENKEATERINALLHGCADYIVGRMGVPYRQKELSIISVVMDAPGDVISALAGRLGSLAGVSVKTVYAPSSK